MQAAMRLLGSILLECCTRSLSCRRAGRPNNRIYFRAGEIIGASLNCVPLNAEVSYIMTPDPRGRQDMAAKIHILPNKLDVAKITACEGTTGP